MDWRWRKLRHNAALGGAAIAIALASGSCDLEDIFGFSLGGGGPENLTGQNAFVHLAADPTSAQSTDIDAVLQVLAWQSDEGGATSASRFQPDSNVLDLLQATARARGSIRPEGFQLLDFGDLAPEDGVQQKNVFLPVNLDALRDEYVIPNLDAIPVRNQGSRGTCAAFAGIAQIEYAVLQANPSLRTIDLSEQRFYYNSKPECQATGCTSADAGSWYGVGYDASVNSSVLDIPLESDCPYNSTQTSNELQVPQAAGCSNGAVRVVDYDVVYQPTEMIRTLEAGLPIPFASPLSDNYFSTNGLITQRDAGPAGNVFHAAGHAYLIVGYRKLPNMPEEGGMCFIIKNSWGTGWGANGYACMTLAWMQEWNYGYALDHPVAVSVALREDLSGGSIPDNNDDSMPDFVDDQVYNDETIDYDRLDDDLNVPDADPNDLTWRSGRLAGPDGRFYRLQIADTSNGVAFRGWVRTRDVHTGYVEVERNGDLLIFDGDEVGRMSGNDVTLCTGAYDPICSLRFEPNGNRLYVEFLYNEFRSVKSNELQGGQWQTLIPLDVGLNLEFYRPQSVVDAVFSPVYVRGLRNDGTQTDPIRLTLSGLEIKAMGQTVGSLSPGNFGLCSGTYQGRCSLFSGQNRLVVLPNW